MKLILALFIVLLTYTVINASPGYPPGVTPPFQPTCQDGSTPYTINGVGLYCW